MNAWTSVFVVSTVSDDLTCRSWRSWKKHARQSEATWSDMLSWLSMVTPRFVTDPEKLTLAPRSCNSLTDSLFSCCLVPSHNSWVLSAFILSRLLLIHASIRSTHEVKRCTMVDADVAGALMYTWQHSKHTMHQASWLQVKVCLQCSQSLSLCGTAK